MASNKASPFEMQWPLLSYQPLKLLYVLIRITSTLAQVPLWLTIWLIPRLRPNPKWSLLQCLSNWLVSANLDTLSRIRSVTPFPLAPGKEKSRWEIVHPSRKDIYVDVLDSVPTIRPEVTGGVWHPALPAKGAAPVNTILHFHGGAFTVGSPRDTDMGFAGRTMAKYVAPQVFMGGYRLSSSPGNQFPAALQDAVTHFQHLLDMGIPASHIVLSGDSAGANLAFALLKYIHEHKDLFPSVPAAILLWSPWVDLTNANTPHVLTQMTNFHSDYIPTTFPQWGSINYIGHRTPGDPYISPTYNTFVAEGTPLFVQAGSSELLYDECKDFVEKMRDEEKNGKKNKIEFAVVAEANHDIIFVGDILGWKKETEEVAEQAGRWLKRVTSA